MTHIKTRRNEDLQEVQHLLQRAEAAMGFVPESFYTMAHWPELLESLANLAGTVMATGELDPGLKNLIAFVTSNAAGCRYCQAHTAHGAERRGVASEKLKAAFEFESSPLFSDAERAALRVAFYAGVVPNGVEKSHMDELQKHYSEKQIVEVVGVVATFGFLNRWNDTMATTLEDDPKSFATDVLADKGWAPGKHDA